MRSDLGRFDDPVSGTSEVQMVFHCLDAFGPRMREQQQISLALESGPHGAQGI